MAFVVGCGSSDHGNVTGTLLRKDGTPLAGARVVARSLETGDSAYGITDSAGKFDLGKSGEAPGIPPGEYAVFIIENRGDPDHRQPVSIAAKYRNPSASGLKVKVAQGEQAEVNLTLDPPQK
jgi:hypothetical protein